MGYEQGHLLSLAQGSLKLASHECNEDLHQFFPLILLEEMAGIQDRCVWLPSIVHVRYNKRRTA